MAYGQPGQYRVAWWSLAGPRPGWWPAGRPGREGSAGQSSPCEPPPGLAVPQLSLSQRPAAVPGQPALPAAARTQGTPAFRFHYATYPQFWSCEEPNKPLALLPGPLCSARQCFLAPRLLQTPPSPGVPAPAAPAPCPLAAPQQHKIEILSKTSTVLQDIPLPLPPKARDVHALTVFPKNSLRGLHTGNFISKAVIQKHSPVLSVAGPPGVRRAIRTGGSPLLQSDVTGAAPGLAWPPGHHPP